MRSTTASSVLVGRESKTNDQIVEWRGRYWSWMMFVASSVMSSFAESKLTWSQCCHLFVVMSLDVVREAIDTIPLLPGWCHQSPNSTVFLGVNVSPASCGDMTLVCFRLGLLPRATVPLDPLKKVLGYGWTLPTTILRSTGTTSVVVVTALEPLMNRQFAYNLK